MESGKVEMTQKWKNFQDLWQQKKDEPLNQTHRSQTRKQRAQRETGNGLGTIQSGTRISHTFYLFWEILTSEICSLNSGFDILLAAQWRSMYQSFTKHVQLSKCCKPDTTAASGSSASACQRKVVPVQQCPHGIGTTGLYSPKYDRSTTA